MTPWLEEEGGFFTPDSDVDATASDDEDLEMPRDAADAEADEGDGVLEEPDVPSTKNASTEADQNDAAGGEQAQG
jgi:hypothetical protein